MSEIEKALAELKALMKYRAEQLGHVEDFRGLGLTSRKNLCLHPSVKREKSGSVVDARCRSLTAGFVKEKKERGEEVDVCVYHDNLDLLEPHNLLPAGVFTLDGLIRYGEQQKQCPYFSARRMMAFCNVIIYSYHYLLDPKIAERVSKELSKDCIVVFDEAHNIDNVCIESLSIDITEDSLRKATRGANNLEREIERMKSSDEEKLQNEYQKLVEGLREADEARAEDQFMSNPTLPDDLLKEAVPGNIRRAEHFVAFLKRFIEYLKTRMKVLYVIQETPPSFLAHLKDLTYIERKPLRFCAERLTSLVRTLELSNIEDYQPLQDIATFATLVATYESGFLLILEPYESDQAQVPNPILHFTCLDASIAIKPVFERFSSVIITSGTISPLEMYPKMLNFTTVTQESYPMSLARRSFLPMIVTRGSDQQSISSGFQVRSDPGVVRNYGSLLFEFAKITPDGLVVFFPSYLYMEMIISMWQGMGILDQIWNYKLPPCGNPRRARDLPGPRNLPHRLRKRQRCDPPLRRARESFRRNRFRPPLRPGRPLHGRAIPVHRITHPQSPPGVPPRHLPHQRTRLPVLRRDAARGAVPRPCPTRKRRLRRHGASGPALPEETQSAPALDRGRDPRGPDRTQHGCRRRAGEEVSEKHRAAAA